MEASQVFNPIIPI